MRIIIWSKTLESGKEELERILFGYQRLNIEIVERKDFRDDTRVVFKNGHCIRVIPARESMKGVKCNISIVERSIDQEFFDCIIRACTSIPPFQAFRFFGEGELIL